MNKTYNIQVEKIGRKWIQAKIQGRDYWFKGQILINDYTKHFQVGQVYKVYAILENKGNGYGSKFEMKVVGLHESEMQRYWEATNGVDYLKEQERRAIETIRECNKHKIFNNMAVETLRKLGVFEKYQDEIRQYELEYRKEVERKRLENLERMERAAKEKEIREVELRRKTEESIKQRREEEYRQREQKRKEEESLLQFQSPQKYNTGEVLYKQGKALKVVKNRKVDAESTGNEIYWEMNYGQDYFYNVYCEDVSNTVEGQGIIKKGREKENRVVLKKEFNSLLEDIEKYLSENGNSINQEDIKGKEIFRLDRVQENTVITLDITTNTVFYFNEIGSGGLDWSWDGKTILAVDLTAELRGKLEKLVSLKSKIE